MQAAAARLLGEHDFRNFCKMDPVYVSNYTRRVLDCTLQRYIPGRCALRAPRSSTSARSLAAAAHRSSEEDVWYLQVRGTAFLWHQIRCMVSVLFLVGDGREEPSVRAVAGTRDGLRLTIAQVVDWLLDVTRCPRRPTYLMASEVPLLFYDVEFEGLRFRHSRGACLGARQRSMVATALLTCRQSRCNRQPHTLSACGHPMPLRLVRACGAPMRVADWARGAGGAYQDLPRPPRHVRSGSRGRGGWARGAVAGGAAASRPRLCGVHAGRPQAAARA